MQAEGWDYDEDVANNDMEAEVNKEVAAERQEEELAELEHEHLELEKVLKKEGRVDNQKDEDDQGYKLDLDEDEEDEELPTVAASRRREQEAEKEGRKHMNKLRKRVKVLSSCPSMPFFCRSPKLWLHRYVVLVLACFAACSTVNRCV